MIKICFLILLFLFHLPLKNIQGKEILSFVNLNDSSLTSVNPSDTIKLTFKDKVKADTNYFNIFPKDPNSLKLALVLSGGGARGIAQLGVIRALEEYNVDVDIIVGTSIGTVIGGLYASGYTTYEIEKIIKDFNWDRALSLTNKYQRTSLFLEQKKIQDRSLLTIPLDGINPDILPSSFSNGQYLSEKINTLILNARYHAKNSFNDLKIPFVAVATDITTGDKVVLKKGNLSESIKASITFPLLYTPININGRKLVDGGLSANIPTDIAKEQGADFTLIVNSTSPLKSIKDLNDPLNTADQILSITMMQLSNLQLKDANAILTPDIKNFSSNSYSNFDYLIRKGYESVVENIKSTLNAIDSLEIAKSKYFNNFVTNPEIIINTPDDLLPIIDSVLKRSSQNFLKYTEIEKDLKDVYKTGYFEDAYAVISRDNNSVKINYHFIPYPVFRNATINISDLNINKDVENFIIKNSGKYLNVLAADDFRNVLLGNLRDEGYSLKDITKFYFEHNTGILEIKVDDGKINAYKLIGNKVTKDNVILREMKTDISNPIRSKDVNLSLKNVMSTNLFQQISFDYLYEKNNENPDLLIRVIEKNTKALRFTLKADNEKNLQLLFDLRDENILGSAIEAGILAAGGLRNRIYEIEIKSNQFFSLPLTFNLNGFYIFNDIYTYIQVNDTNENEYSVIRTGEYRNLKTGSSFLFGTQLERYGTFYIQGIAENLEIINKSNNEDKSSNANVFKLRLGGVIDTEDKIPFPNEGVLLNFYYETAKNINEGNQSYTKLFFNYDQFIPLSAVSTIKPRFTFGFGDKTTPLSEQFSMGGQKNFFGMVENELVGRQILIASAEYRYEFPYRLFFDTYISIRYDLGNVWENTTDIRFKDLRHGLGLSASFDTPIGEAVFSVGRSFQITSGFNKNSFIFGPYDFYYTLGFDI